MQLRDIRRFARAALVIAAASEFPPETRRMVVAESLAWLAIERARAKRAATAREISALERSMKEIRTRLA